MSSVNLAEYLRVVSNDIFSLQQEIGCASSPLYETNMMETWQTIIEEYQQKLELEKISLIERCSSRQSQIAHKHSLLGEPTSTSTSIEPPYRALLAELDQQLAEISLRTAEKEAQRARISQHIDELCAQLKVRKPPLPDLLTEEALNTYTDTESQLEETRSNRLKLAHECDRNLLMWRTYLGKPHMARGPVALDENSIEQLKKTCADVQAAYESRFREIEAYETEITQLAEALQVPAEIPAKNEGCGTQSRIDALENRLHELKLLRLEKLPELIDKARESLAKVWDQIFYDHTLRNTYPDEPPTEELLDRLNKQEKFLLEEAENPSRAQIIATIRKLQTVFETETKLRNLSNDPQKLAKGGFMTIIKEEGRLRMVVTKQKPETIAKLRSLLAEWHQDHPSETFFLDGEDINSKLQSDDLARLAHRSTMNLKRPRPSSSASPNLPPKRAQPLSSRLMATPTVRGAHSKQANPITGVKQGTKRSGVSTQPAPSGEPERMYPLPSPVLPATQSTGIIPTASSIPKRYPVMQSASQQARNNAVSGQIRAAGSVRKLAPSTNNTSQSRRLINSGASLTATHHRSTKKLVEHNVDNNTSGKEAPGRSSKPALCWKSASKSKNVASNSPSFPRAPSAVSALAPRDPNTLATSKSRLGMVVKKNRADLEKTTALAPKRPHTSPGSFATPLSSQSPKPPPPSKHTSSREFVEAVNPLRLDDNHQLMPAHPDVENPVWNPILTGNADVESSFFANESVIPPNSPYRLSVHRDCSMGF